MQIIKEYIYIYNPGEEEETRERERLTNRAGRFLLSMAAPQATNRQVVCSCKNKLITNMTSQLIEMFSLLPANSLHRFKCVSKVWCGLVTDPLHRQLFAQTVAGFLCRVDGDGDTESSRLTRPNAMVLERKETMRRFVNVSGMAELHPDAKGLHNVILDDCDGLVLLARARGHEPPDLHPPACYLVRNPTTTWWASVPGSDWVPSTSQRTALTYLLFGGGGGGGSAERVANLP
jgi:hypothetical protein